MRSTARFSLILSFLTASPALAEDGLKNESEAGIVITSGNTETTTVNLKQTVTHVANRNTIRFAGSYLSSTNRGVEQAFTWSLGLRYERAVDDSWSAFLGQLVESNIFQNILQRYATDIGTKYIFRNLETFKWFGEAGYRFARENYTNGDYKNINFVRLYSEGQYFWSSTVSTKLWVELLPNLTESDAYQFNAELSLIAALSDIFSVKTAHLVRHNNRPPAGTAFKTDSTFTTALVARF